MCTVVGGWRDAPAPGISGDTSLYEMVCVVPVEAGRSQELGPCHDVSPQTPGLDRQTPARNLHVACAQLPQTQCVPTGADFLLSKSGLPLGSSSQQMAAPSTESSRPEAAHCSSLFLLQQQQPSIKPPFAEHQLCASRRELPCPCEVGTMTIPAGQTRKWRLRGMMELRKGPL